jgi:hypothetical protein
LLYWALFLQSVFSSLFQCHITLMTITFDAKFIQSEMSYFHFFKIDQDDIIVLIMVILFHSFLYICLVDWFQYNTLGYCMVNFEETSFLSFLFLFIYCFKNFWFFFCDVQALKHLIPFLTCISFSSTHYLIGKDKHFYLEIIRCFSWNNTNVLHWRFNHDRSLSTSWDVSKLKVHKLFLCLKLLQPVLGDVNGSLHLTTTFHRNAQLNRSCNIIFILRI